MVWLTSAASFTQKVILHLGKRPLETNGRLANIEITSLVKDTTEMLSSPNHMLIICEMAKRRQSSRFFDMMSFEQENI